MGKGANRSVRYKRLPRHATATRAASKKHGSGRVTPMRGFPQRLRAEDVIAFIGDYELAEPRVRAVPPNDWDDLHRSRGKKPKGKKPVSSRERKRIARWNGLALMNPSWPVSRGHWDLLLDEVSELEEHDLHALARNGSPFERKAARFFLGAGEEHSLYNVRPIAGTVKRWGKSGRSVKGTKRDLALPNPSDAVKALRAKFRADHGDDWSKDKKLKAKYDAMKPKGALAAASSKPKRSAAKRGSAVKPKPKLAPAVVPQWEVFDLTNLGGGSGNSRAVEAMLKRLPDTRSAVWSLDVADPTQVVKKGKFKFAFERSMGPGNWDKYVTHEVSVEYTNPTYEDAWREFRRMSANYAKKVGPYDHVFLEEVVPGEKRGTLSFATGS